MIEKLLKKIKEKKPLHRLDDEFIKEKIKKYIEKNDKINLERKKEFEKAVKAIRSELNKVYGIFWGGFKSLKDHKASSERINFYPELYKKIFEITGKPKKILDLACGLNPLSYSYIKNCEFIVNELSKEDCMMLEEYFKENKIKGKVICGDLIKNIEFPPVDICFMFKVLDTIENKSFKIGERLIKEIDAGYFVISFSTKTLRKKLMNYPRRGSFERMMKRLNLKYKKLFFPGEVFYIVKKY